MLSDIKTHRLAPWLALLHTPGIGPRRYATLLEKLGPPSNILQYDKGQLQQSGLSEKIIDASKSKRCKGCKVTVAANSGVLHI